jgi:hypothetical protein
MILTEQYCSIILIFLFSIISFVLFFVKQKKHPKTYRETKDNIGATYILTSGIGYVDL